MYTVFLKHYAGWVLTDSSYIDKVNAFHTSRSDMPSSFEEDQSEPFSKTIKTFLIEDSALAGIDNKLLDRVRDQMTERDPAYILYTSGSTGQPKGTVISHRCIVSYGSWFIHAFDIDQATIFGSQTPLYFSMSVSDFYAAHRTGATYRLFQRSIFHSRCSLWNI